MADMAQRHRTFWQKNKPFIITIIVISVVTVAFVVVAYAFGWDWAGFTRKNLWDWLQLLIVPVMLAIGGYWLNQMQKSREEDTAQRPSKKLDKARRCQVHLRQERMFQEDAVSDGTGHTHDETSP